MTINIETVHIHADQELIKQRYWEVFKNITIGGNKE